MSSSTHRLEITDAAYTNVSNGNANCSLFTRYRQDIRVHIGGSAPAPDTVDYFDAGGGGLAGDYSGNRLATRFNNLLAEDDIWVRAETGSDVVVVVRGDVIM
jgi:hypothetical protein